MVVTFVNKDFAKTVFHTFVNRIAADPNFVEKLYSSLAGVAFVKRTYSYLEPDPEKKFLLSGQAGGKVHAALSYADITSLLHSMITTCGLESFKPIDALVYDQSPRSINIEIKKALEKEGWEVCEDVYVPDSLDSGSYRAFVIGEKVIVFRWNSKTRAALTGVGKYGDPEVSFNSGVKLTVNKDQVLFKKSNLSESGDDFFFALHGQYLKNQYEQLPTTENYDKMAHWLMSNRNRIFEILEKSS